MLCLNQIFCVGWLLLTVELSGSVSDDISYTHTVVQSYSHRYTKSNSLVSPNFIIRHRKLYLHHITTHINTNHSHAVDSDFSDSSPEICGPRRQASQILCIASSRLKWNYNEITTSSQAEIDVLYLLQEIPSCFLPLFTFTFLRKQIIKKIFLGSEICLETPTV